MADTFTFDSLHRTEFAAAFAANDGVVTTHSVPLPEGFDPTNSAFTILENGPVVEIFCPSTLDYSGPDPEWQRITAGAEVPGGARLVGTLPGGLDEALDLLTDLLGAAREEKLPNAALAANGNGAAWIKPAQSPVPPPGSRRRRAHELTDLAAVDSERSSQRVIDAHALHAELSRHVVGQDFALGQMTRALQRHLAKTRPERPTTVFLVGPSGVGKTATAQALPESLRALDGDLPLFGFTVINMNEFRHESDVTKLLGAAPGFVGHGDSSALVKALAANPFSIIVFDEIDKAHPSMATALMSAIDSGRLGLTSPVDGHFTLDTSHAVFVFTSNQAASPILQEMLTNDARTVHEINEICRGQLHAAGVPDPIVGRIGEFLVYRPLDAQARAEIAALSVQRVAAEFGIEIAAVEPEIINEILRRSGNEDLGVRPVVHVVTELLGAAFVATVARGSIGPHEVRSDPPRCEPASGAPDAGSIAADRGVTDPHLN